MRALLYLLLIGLSACSYLPVNETPNRDQNTTGGMEDRTGSADTGSSASGAATASGELLHQSRASQAVGEYEQAASDIERALRIEPRNSYLWLELGRIRLATGNTQQAAALAQKAMNMANDDANARRAAQQLLEEATWFQQR